MPTIEARLRRVEAYQQLLELPCRYAWHVARGEGAAVAALFTDDGYFEAPAYQSKDRTRHKISGLDAIRAYMLNLKPLRVIPLIHNQIIDIQGDQATGTCVMRTPHAPTLPDGFIGRYQDDMRCIDGVWRFSARRFYLFAPYFEES